ncbi:MAG: DUF1499 domain-containing protein [Planctomycetota bacterium]
MTYLLIALAVAAAATPVVLTLAAVDDWSRDFSTNRAATNPDAQHAMMRPLTQRFTAEQVAEALADICRQQSAWRMPDPPKPLPEDSPLPADGALAVHHLVRTTPIMRYRDDVWAVVEKHDDVPNGDGPDGDGQNGDGQNGGGKLRVHLESRSRLGKGDLGQNPRNIRELNGLLLVRLVIKAPPAKP